MRELLHQFGLLILCRPSVRSSPLRSNIFFDHVRDSSIPPCTPIPFVLQPDAAQPSSLGLVETATYWVKNAGREAATEVDVTFNYKPQFYNVWPPRPFEKIDGFENRHTLKFSNIAAGEELHIELVSSGIQLPIIVSFRSNEGVASLIAMRFQGTPKQVTLIIAYMLLFISISTVVYFSTFYAFKYIMFLFQP